MFGKKKVKETPENVSTGADLISKQEEEQVNFLVKNKPISQ